MDERKQAKRIIPATQIDHHESRRGFLRRLVLGTEAAVKNPSGGTLVCIFLRGGADTLNMLVPYGDKEYYKVRPTIAIPPPGKAENASLKLDDFYSLHPKLAPLLSIFHSGELGIVQGAGTDNPTGSHFESQDQMEHGACYKGSVSGGWLGRFMRTRTLENQTPFSAVAIGEVIPESFRGSPVTSAIRKVEDIRIDLPPSDADAVCAALAQMYSAEIGILKEPGSTSLNLLKRVEKFKSKQYKPENAAEYSDNEFAQGLKEVARLIKAEVGLEVACLDLDGWDTHFFQGGAEGQQALQIEQLGNGLGAFYADLRKYNHKVTTVVMTEFGRRIYENGSLGTDHGRGFAFFALGAGINGGKVRGKYPGLHNDQYELGPGGMKITCDYRSVLSEILTWRDAPISEIFPDFVPEPVGLVSPRATG